MDSSISPKDEIWLLRVCHHISNAVYQKRSATPSTLDIIRRSVGFHKKTPNITVYIVITLPVSEVPIDHTLAQG